MGGYCAWSPYRYVWKPASAYSCLSIKRQGGGIGAAALCGGGGQGDALILKAT